MGAPFTLSEDVSQAWVRARTGWQGQHADVFHEEYILKLQALAEDADRISARLRDANRALKDALDEVICMSGN